MSIFSSLRYCLGDPSDFDDVWIALGFMPLALFFDFLDGRIARWRRKSSLMGQELDSLADLVRGFFIIRFEEEEEEKANCCQISFGVAPASVAFAIGVRSRLDHLFLSFFVLCGLARLARFNVTASVLPKDKSGKSKYFEGTPIPTTLAITLAMSYWLWKGLVLENLPLGVLAQGTLFELHPVTFVFVIHGCLMVSKTIHIPKP